MKIVLGIILSLMLGGCAAGFNPADMGGRTEIKPDGTTITYSAPGDITGGNLELVRGCIEYRRQQQEASDNTLSGLPESQRALVLMHRDSMNAMAKAVGRNVDECRPGTNVWDAYIADVKERQATYRDLSKGALDLAKTGIYAWAIGKVVDNMGDKTTIAGGSSQSGSYNSNYANRDGMFSQTPSGVGSNDTIISRDTITGNTVK